MAELSWINDTKVEWLSCRARPRTPGGDKVAVAAVGVAEQGYGSMCIDSFNLAWPWSIRCVPRKLAEGCLLEMVGELIDHAAGMIGGAELERVKQAVKILPADLRIELVQIKHLGLLNLRSDRQRLEGGPGERPKRLYSSQWQGGRDRWSRAWAPGLLHLPEAVPEPQRKHLDPWVQLVGGMQVG